MPPGLDVLGSLTVLAGDGGPFRVEFLGGVVAVRLPDLRSAMGLGRGLTRAGRRERLGQFRKALAAAGLELQVWVGRDLVGRLGSGTRPSRVAVWLGLDPMEVSLRPALASLARRRAGPQPGGSAARPRDGVTR